MKQLAWFIFLMTIAWAGTAQMDSSQLITNKEVVRIRARILAQDGLKILVNTPCFLAVPGKYFQLSAARTDSLGIGWLPLRKTTYPRQAVIQSFPENDTGYHVELTEPFISPVDDAAIKALVSASPLRIEDTLPFYGIPDKTYLLDNFTRFPTMQEVLSEFIPEARARKQRSHYVITVVNAPFMSFFENQPLLLLDGLPVRSDKLMALDPLRIARIEVVTRRYYFGSLTFDGILSLRSYNGDLAGYQLDSDARVVDIPASTN